MESDKTNFYSSYIIDESFKKENKPIFQHASLLVLFDLIFPVFFPIFSRINHA